MSDRGTSSHTSSLQAIKNCSSFPVWAREQLEQWQQHLPPDIVGVVREILEGFDVNFEEGQIYLYEEGVQVRGFDDINYPIEVLLYRTGYADRVKDRNKLGLLIFTLASLVKGWVVCKLRERKPVEVEIRHVTERERLAYEIAERILSEYTIKTFYTTSADREHEIGVYCWDGLVYKPCENQILSSIMKYLESVELKQKTTRWVVNEAMFKIKLNTLTKLHYEPLAIAFKNGIFMWETFLKTGSLRVSLVKPSPDLIVFHKIPHRLALERLNELEGLVKFSENLAIGDLEWLARRLCPKTLKAFKDWVGDKWVLLFEIIGYTLYPKYDLHKAVMIVGEGRNGKSTYLRLLKDILGSWNVSSIKLQDLCDDSKRFVVANLYRKLANIYADLPSEALRNTGTFKVLTGEDAITADRKFRDPITFVNYAKLIFSTNQLPVVKDMSLAFWRRWIVIEFPNQFPINPRFYEETFTEEEIEGAIIVGLLAFRGVWLRRKFSFEETEADYKEKWLRQVNSVYAFVQDLLAGRVDGYRAEKDEDGKVEAGKLYELYVKWCESEDREALPKRKFTMEMERLGYRKVRTARASYYKGLKLIERSQNTLG